MILIIKDWSLLLASSGWGLGMLTHLKKILFVQESCKSGDYWVHL